MADQDNKPTEEQVKQANEAELKRWEGDFNPEDLKVPYSREETVEDEKTEDKKPEDDEEEAQDAEQYSDPTPIVTVQDPGEYKPADYSFQVTDKDGKPVKITSVEEADRFADDDDNFKTARELKDFMVKSHKMESRLERDKEKYDESKKKFDEQNQSETERLETVNNLSKEFDYLVNKKLLPTVDSKYLNADWSDPEVAKQPGVKEQVALLNYMVKENQARSKAGVRPLTSIVDAFNARKLEEGEKEQEQADKAAGAARKAAGARVAGVSSSPGHVSAPAGIAVGNPNVFKRNQAMWD